MLQVTLYPLVTNEVVDLGYLFLKKEVLERGLNLVPPSTRGFNFESCYLHVYFLPPARFSEKTIRRFDWSEQYLKSSGISYIRTFNSTATSETFQGRYLILESSR